MQEQIFLTECPRDAMQGWTKMIPTEQKIAYLNQLLRVGFDVLDFGSYVSAKAIPQMADTPEVLAGLDLSATRSKLLAIIANHRGAEQAAAQTEISILGFPFSISETFQLRNTNKTIEQSLESVQQIQDTATKHGKEVQIYISMAFGNPYGDAYSAQTAIEWVGRLAELGIRRFAMSDTVGVANPENTSMIFSSLIPAFPELIIGAHFHSTPATRIEKISAAYEAGCRHFDSAIGGIGGCPMAKDDLVGNMATETLLQYFPTEAMPELDLQAFSEAMQQSQQVFKL